MVTSTLLHLSSRIVLLIHHQSIDDFIEIPASNDNIVKEGQTPVPVQNDQTPVYENHIEANVSTRILPDLDNIVVIFEEDPLATVENVNISLDVQNGEVTLFQYICCSH